MYFPEVDNGVGGKLSSKESEYEKLSRENLTTISSYGHSLMEVVCRDASDGHQVGRVRNVLLKKWIFSVGAGIGCSLYMYTQ